jgi:hypothetical protein
MPSFCILLPVLTVTLCLLHADGATLDSLKQTYETKLQSIGDKHAAKDTQLLDAYGRLLGEAVSNLKQEGDPDKVIEGITELKRFEEERTVPAAPGAGLPRALQNVRRTYLGAVRRARIDKEKTSTELSLLYCAALDRLMRSLTADGKLDLALNVKEEKARVQFIMADTEMALRRLGFAALPDAYAKRSLDQREAILRRQRAPPEIDTTVTRGLAWLRSKQDADGHWDATPGKSGVSTESRAASTAFALLAFLAHGDVPGDSPVGRTVASGVQWLIRNQNANGRFSGSDGHEYALPIVAYALCEAHGMTGDQETGNAAARAIDIIVTGQQSKGGWNYNCDKLDRNDLSYSAWCVQALFAAAVAGLDRPGLAAALQKAKGGIRANAARSGAFGYTSPGTTRLTGAGVYCLQLLGEGASQEVSRGLSWLEKNVTPFKAHAAKRPYYYGYYDTAAAFHGRSSRLRTWSRNAVRELARSQIAALGSGLDGEDTGYWEVLADNERYGLVYTTSLSCLILQNYYRQTELPGKMASGR